MSLRSDGMNYAPQGKPTPVVRPGEFVFAAAHLDHGHIYGQCNGLTEAGATLRWVYDPDLRKVAAFREKFPASKVARSLDEILADPEVRLVAAAAVPSEHGPLGCRVLQAGKDYFTDKTPFTTLEQLDRAKSVTEKTGCKYMVYFSERLHVESAMFATDLVKDAASPVEQAVPVRLVLPEGGLWRHPLRHRQPPMRAVPHLYRRNRRHDHLRGRRQLWQSRQT